MTGLNNSNNDLSSDLQQKLYSLIGDYFINNRHERRYPGLISQQGKRTILQINVNAKELVNLLQAKPTTANNPDSGKDRPEIKGHADEIKEYIVERANASKPWILGTFTATVAPERITVIELFKSVCIVIIPSEVKLDITDGQHRKKAIEGLLHTNENKLISEQFFPITLILEDNFNQSKTDFRDMAQAKPVDKSLLLSFGDSGVRGIVTMSLIEKVFIFKGKTDKINKAPSRKNKLIYTSNYIARFISCAFTDNPEDELENYEFEKCSEILANLLNQLFSECIHTRYIAQTRIENLTVDEISDFKKECLLAVSVGLEILGRLLYCAYDVQSNTFKSEKVSQIAKLDWRRGNNLWHNNVVRINTQLEKPTMNIAWGASAIGDAVKAAKIELGWI